MSGLFITFEANEGAGKSTQCRKLGQRLIDEGHDVVITREPGGSPGAEEIRALVVTGDPDRWSAMTELMLFMAARRDHIEKTIKPALERGAIVLCDRYVGSTLALQVAGGADYDFIEEMHNKFIGLWPDITYFLRISPEVSVQRALAVCGSEDRMEKKGQEFHKAVDAAFEVQVPKYGWVEIDAEGTIDDVHLELYTHIKSRLK
jgi:dTMP kinase